MLKASISFLFSLATLAGCGGSSDSDQPAPACDICAHSRFVCSNSSGLESISFRVASRDATGCHLSGTSPGAGELDIVCEPPQLCRGSTCDVGNFDHDTIVFLTYSCQPATAG